MLPFNRNTNIIYYYTVLLFVFLTLGKYNPNCGGSLKIRNRNNSSADPQHKNCHATVKPLHDNRKTQKQRLAVVTRRPGNTSACSISISQQTTTRLVQWSLCLNSNRVKHKVRGQIGVFGRFARHGNYN